MRFSNTDFQVIYRLDSAKTLKIVSPKKDLPQRTKSKQADQTDQSMKIAWRYTNLPDLDEVSNANKSDCQFELKKKVDDQLIKEKQMTENLKICTHDELLDQLSTKESSLPLVVIKNYATVQSEFDEQQFCTLLLRLKSLSRSSNLCFILSVNSNYLSPLTRQLATNLVDCCLQVDRLTENSVYREDYLGLIKIHKLPKLNCLNYQTTTETLEIGIQLKKNRFLNVDKLFLPPELSDAPSRTACSAAKIDF